jgi:hypothetical protein
MYASGASLQVPLYLAAFQPGFYVNHRTVILVAGRALELFVQTAYLSFWIDFSNQDALFQWTLLVMVFGSGWLALTCW